MVISRQGDCAELAVETARFGAMLARKGLTPDEVATVMREQVQPLLDEAVRRAERGEDISTFEIGLRHAGQLDNTERPVARD